MKYIFFDIDGTVVSHTTGMPVSTAKTIRKLKEIGHKIFLSTGRSLAEMPKAFDEFGFDGYICAAGSHVMADGRVIYEKFMEEEFVDRFIDFLKENNICFALEGEVKTYFGPFGYRKYEKLLAGMEAVKHLSEYPIYDFYIPRDSVEKIENYKDNKTRISKVLLYDMDPKKFDLLDELKDEDISLIRYGNYAEVILKGESKLKGIHRILNHYKADIKDSIAIGDSMNDYEMISGAGIGIAMGNSSEEIKKIADYVTSSVEEDGIYKAMKKIELI